MHVKICGITNTEDALAAARTGAEFVGLILTGSPRQVDLDTARRIAGVLPQSTSAVLVFRNAPLAEVADAVTACRCGWVQLHGREPVSYVHELLKQRPRLRIIRAWEIDGAAAGTELSEYACMAREAGVRVDVYLLDAPKGGAHPGFERLGDIALQFVERPPEIWCAGGLTALNVATAVGAGHYEGVDVASGVETQPGRKDLNALQRFVTTARSL
jgi:phosphoribosylanthranilate isomerase